MSLPSAVAGTPFTTPTCVGAWIEYPFRDQGDSATKLYVHRMQVLNSSYAPLADDDTMTAATQKPVRSPFVDDSAAYYVGDSQISQIDGGLVDFLRMFANIPSERIEPNGFYAFEFPDVPGGIFIEKNSTSETFNYDKPTFLLTLTATLSAADIVNFSDGESVLINNPNNFTYTRGITTSNKSTFSGIASISGNTITIVVEHFYYLSGVKTAFDTFVDNSPANYIAKKIISPDRNATAQLNSQSVIAYRYVKSSFPESITLKQRFQLSNAAGTAIQATTTTSLPLTTAEYVQVALDGEYAIEAENEIVSQWMGNIYELSQIKVQPK